jgi:hypothetical protein
MALRYWVGGAGTWDSTSTEHWSTTGGGSPGASAPTSGDSVQITVNSGTGDILVASSATCSGLTITNNTTITSLILQGNVTFPNTCIISHAFKSINLNNFTLSAGIYSSAASTRVRDIQFGSSGIIILNIATTANIFNNASATGFSYTGTSNIRIVSAAGSGVTLTLNALTSSLNALNFNIPSGAFNLILDRGIAKSLNFTGTYSGSVSIANFFNVYSSLIFNSVMSTVSGTAALGLVGGGAVTATTDGVVLNFPLNISDTGTICEFQNAVTMASGKAFTMSENVSVKLKSGTTNTIDTFVTSGTTLKYLESTTPGAQATISKASGTTTVTYLSIKDSNATGGIWDAANITNINAGNNTGWVFSIDVLISESLSIQDVSSSTQNFINAISEALGLADPNVVTAAFASVASETIASADSLLAGTAFVSSILENLVVSDSPAVLKTFNVSISEPQTIQDAANVIAAFISNISESTTIQESIIGVAAKIITDVTEAILVSNAQTAVVSFVSNINEGIIVADNEATTKTQYAIVVEPLTLNTEQNIFAWVKIENIQSTQWILIDNRQ